MIVITGMRAEAKIAWAPGLSVFACGGNVEMRSQAIRDAIAAGAPAIISFGVAGGLSARLKPGDWIVASNVSSMGRRIETDIEWSTRLMRRLPDVEIGDIVSVSTPVRRREAKRHLNQATGAIAVDMESYWAAALAREHGIPFAAVRVIADPVERELPDAACLAMNSNGAIAIGDVIASLIQQPSQIPSLTRIASDAFIAFRALLKRRDALGPHFASLTCPTVVTTAMTPFSVDVDHPHSAPIPV